MPGAGGRPPARTLFRPRLSHGFVIACAKVSQFVVRYSAGACRTRGTTFHSMSSSALSASAAATAKFPP